MFVLTGDWQRIKSVEGGDILAVNDGHRIRVSFPDNISEDAVRGALSDKGIEVGDGVVFEAGEAEGETIAFFDKTVINHRPSLGREFREKIHSDVESMKTLTTEIIEAIAKEVLPSKELEKYKQSNGLCLAYWETILRMGFYLGYSVQDEILKLNQELADLGVKNSFIFPSLEEYRETLKLLDRGLKAFGITTDHHGEFMDQLERLKAMGI